jgi:hypothetical protein
MRVETVTNLDEFKASNGGANGMILNRAEERQRRDAGDAYSAAFPLSPGTSYRKWADAANQYGSYQIALQRGWAHLAPQPVKWFTH